MQQNRLCGDKDESHKKRMQQICAKYKIRHEWMGKEDFQGIMQEV